MIDLKNYIKRITEASEPEDPSITTLTDLVVVYNAESPILIELPEGYSENDMQIYMDDKYLDDMPANYEKIEKLIGVAKDEISDSYFQYDKFSEYLGPNIPELKWDPHYDTTVDNDARLVKYQITGLKYIMTIAEFKMVDVDASNVKKQFDEIMALTDWGEINKYPIKINYNAKETTYNEK